MRLARWLSSAAINCKKSPYQDIWFKWMTAPSRFAKNSLDSLFLELWSVLGIRSFLVANNCNPFFSRSTFNDMSRKIYSRHLPNNKPIFNTCSRITRKKHNKLVHTQDFRTITCDGQLLILRAGKTYTVMGQEL